MGVVSRRGISFLEFDPHLDGGIPGVDELSDGLFCWSLVPADLVFPFSSGIGDLGFPRSVGMATVSAVRLGFLFPWIRLLLSGVFSCAERVPGGLGQEIGIGLRSRRWLLMLAAGGSEARWWRIRHGGAWCARCWIWMRGYPGTGRSSFKVPFFAAGRSWLQLWRSSLIRFKWCFPLFFAGDSVGFKLWRWACGWFCSDHRRSAVVLCFRSSSCMQCVCSCASYVIVLC